MSSPAKPFTVTPLDGGRTMTAFSLENVGPANYAAKENFRRIEKDREGRREGWVLFKPNAGLPQGVQGRPVASTRLTCLAELVRPNGDRSIIAATKTTIYRYKFSDGTWDTIGTGFSASGKRWQTDTVDGYLIMNNVVNLPVTFRVEDSAVQPIKELREVGVASVGWILECNGLLVCLDVTEIKADQLAGVMTGGDPYGLVTDPTKLNRIAYKVIWSDPNQPRNWAPLFSVTMASASATISLPFPSSAFVAGVTRVAVINGGPNDGTLGGDSAHPDGILVTGVSGSSITLEIPTDSDISYPRTVEVTRWTDVSTLVGSETLQGDASEIIMGKLLNGLIMIYRRGGIFVGRFTGSADKPFEFSDRYKGPLVGSPNVPLWPYAVANVGDEYHLYPAEGGQFYSFDGINPPAVHAVCDAVRDQVFSGSTPEDDVWAVNNPLTSEIWFCRGGKALAFDYKFNTASTIDQEFHAASFAFRPNSTDRWFIFAIEDTIFTYGLVKTADTEIKTFLRNGDAAGGRILGGLQAMGDQFNEKMLEGYVLHFSSGSPAGRHQLDFKLYAAPDAAATPTLLCTQALSTDDNFVPLGFADIYFQDELVVTEEGDYDIQISARTFQRAMINTQSVNRLKNA